MIASSSTLNLSINCCLPVAELKNALRYPFFINCKNNTKVNIQRPLAAPTSAHSVVPPSPTQTHTKLASSAKNVVAVL